MRIATEEHASHDWRVHEIASDFELVDAWELPATGELADFDDLRRIWADTVGQKQQAGPVKALFALREWLGDRFGWDDAPNTEPIPGTDQSSLRERLPAGLAAATDDPYKRSPFRTIFVTDTEAAAELSNSLVHAILHLGWARQPDATYRGYLGVFVKHRGRLGRLYMVLIAPFRHYVVYPTLMKRLGHNWAARNQSGRSWSR